MLDVYSVAFFGHRRVSNFFEVEKRLQEAIRELLREHEYVEFLVGRHGEFDTMAAASVRTAKKEYRGDNSALVLVLPYMTAEFKNNENSFYEYYDEIEVCEDSRGAHFKATITVRNRAVAKRADCVICFIERESGGAFAAVQYARSLGKRVINLADMT